MAEVDLHLHTTFSDGTLTPSELVRLCASNGVKIISVSDHDSTEGLREAEEAIHQFSDMELIPGVELSTDVPNAEVHLLGYFVDVEDANFQRVLARFREGRVERGRSMVERLNELGLGITWERVQQIADGASIGRPHIAQALVEAGYVKYPKDAFDKYIGRNGVAYVERIRVTPVDAVGILIDNGALPVLAHPTYYDDKSQQGDDSGLRTVLQELKDAGLVGMEVYYKDYTPDQVVQLKRLADDFDLVPCGGTDYHASGNPGEPEPGAAGPAMDTVVELKRLKKERAVAS
ncbi:MAG: PHP domain-containing protein [Chloroflexi bacterium]|nr:PHP domain-containing protein [Chloroflexota bacterium]